MLKFLVESPWERKLYRLGGEKLVVGRSRAADIPLLDEQVKKRHLIFFRDGGSWRFKDLSGGATRRNRQAAAEGAMTVGDRFELGTTTLTLQAVLRDAPAPDGVAAAAAPEPEPEPEPRSGEPAEPAPGPGLLTGSLSVRLDPAEDEHFLAAGFRSILEFNKRLVRESEEGRLLPPLLDAAIDLTGAERGFLVLRAGDQFRIKVARNIEGDELRNPEGEFSRSITRRAMEGRRAVLSSDAATDERWVGMQSVVDLRLRSVLSVPLVAEEGVLGALYVDHQGEAGVFTQRHVSLLEALADQAALAIVGIRRTAELLRRGEELEARNREIRELNSRLSAELSQAREDLKTRQGELEFRYDYEQIVGRSEPIREVLTVLDKVTGLNVPVFIEGESGTGKELVARAIHFNSSRRKGRFVTENCSAVPETLIEKVLFGHVKGAFTGADQDAPGLFEQADGGTLFLDEIGDMGAEMQKKILRVLQEGEVRRVGGKETVKLDVRIVCATNRDVDRMKEEGRFREDLYWRLVVVRLRMPPLRERTEDIPLLVEHFLRLCAEEMGTAPKTVAGEALELLTEYSWPGNVRELGNEIRRATALAGERIRPENLSDRVWGGRGDPGLEITGDRKLRDVVADVERALIRKALDRHEGNKTRVAEHLGLSRLGLRNKMERYGIDG